MFDNNPWQDAAKARRAALFGEAFDPIKRQREEAKKEDAARAAKAAKQGKGQKVDPRIFGESSADKGSDFDHNEYGAGAYKAKRKEQEDKAEAARRANPDLAAGMATIKPSKKIYRESSADKGSDYDHNEYGAGAYNAKRKEQEEKAEAARRANPDLAAGMATAKASTKGKRPPSYAQRNHSANEEMRYSDWKAELMENHPFVEVMPTQGKKLKAATVAAKKAKKEVKEEYELYELDEESAGRIQYLTKMLPFLDDDAAISAREEIKALKATATVSPKKNQDK